MRKRKTQKGVPCEYEFRTILENPLATIASNHRAVEVSNLKTIAAAGGGDGIMPKYKRFSWEVLAYNLAEQAKIEFFAIFAEAGATFTSGNIPHTTEMQSGLNALVDKEFSFRTLGTILADNQAVNEEVGLFSYNRSKRINLLSIMKKVEKLAEDPMFSDICPEVFIVALATTPAASTTVINCYETRSFEHEARNSTVIGF